MKKKCVISLVIGLLAVSYADDGASVSPLYVDLMKITANHDPSNDAIVNDEVPEEEIKSGRAKPYLERRRIVTDLNGDGVDDLILSDTMDSWGRTFGGVIYVHTNSVWLGRGEVFFNHNSVTLEKSINGIDVWSHINMSGGESAFICSKIVDGKVPQDMGKIIVNWPNDDTGVIPRIYASIFGYPGTHPFRLEESETSTNGIVSWKLIRDNRKPCKVNEIYELKKKLSEAENRAAELEQKVNELSAEVKRYQFGMREFSGVQLGMKWKGGALTRPCEEIFTGFTNMTIKLDADGYVKRIRLTRKEGERTLQTLMNTRNSKAIPEEQKTIHEVENHFRVRLTWGSSAYKNTKTGRPRREYSWGNPLVGNWIDVFFANGDTDESRIDMIYSYDYLRNPGDED